MKKKILGRRLGVLLATLGLIFGSITIASPAYADSTLCTTSGSDFSGCNTSGRTSHGYENHYTNSYWNAYSGHNCTNYVGYMLSQNGDSGHGVAMGNATKWDNTIVANPAWGYAINTTPAIGAIAQWEGDDNNPNVSPGHVAYVESVNSDGSITVSEDNVILNGVSSYRWRTITTTGNWPTRFLHIKDVNTQNQWHLRDYNSDGPATTAFTFGSATTDTPIVGDWDGNGTFTPGITRQVNGELQWHLRNTNTAGGASVSFNYGAASDMPIVGDWDGNGTFTPGLVRIVNSELRWYLKNSHSGGNADVAFAYGMSTDKPIVGDWDGNGTSTAGINRSSGGVWQWHLRNTNDAGAANVAYSYGSAVNDTPISGDWDGNNSWTGGIYRAG